MRQITLTMGMPTALEIPGERVSQDVFDRAFSYFRYIDKTFSTYKETSEISQLNRGEVILENASLDMQEIFRLAEKTKDETHGFFNIRTPREMFDPSGIVKGWSIFKAGKIIEEMGYIDYCLEVGGDIQVRRAESSEDAWRIGIRNPFNREEIIKVVYLRDEGLATSGTSIRGQHIYNPHAPDKSLTEIVSLSVIGPNIYEADRFATAAFAMGTEGIYFIESLPGFEGYQVDRHGQATPTSNFDYYTHPRYV